MATITTTRKHPLAKCEECPLQNKRCAPTYGPADAEIAVVSRSPGKQDIWKKKPFGGQSGKILEYLLKLYGKERDEVLTTNIVLCEFDGSPPKAAIDACSERLYSEIQNARTVIAAGAEAVAKLTKRKSLAGSRGYVHKRYSNGRTQRVIATNNPALAIRDDSSFPDLIRDFKLALDPLPPAKLPTVRWTNNVSEGREWLRILSNQDVPLLSVDIETKGLRADAQIVAIAFSGAGDRAISLGERPVNDSIIFGNYIKPLLESRGGDLYHNGKFDVRNLRKHGINTVVGEDTMLLSYALDERSDEEQVHKLEYLLMNELGWPNYEPYEVREYKATVRRLERQLKFDQLNKLPVPDELYPYNALDAAGTSQLFPVLEKKAKEDNVWEKPYKSMLLPLSEALIQAELEGVPFDVEKAFDMLEEEVWPKLNELKEELRLIVGDGAYNPNSAPQNSRLVYDVWNVIHSLPLKNERSVDKSVYTEIKAGRFVIGGFESPAGGGNGDDSSSFSGEREDSLQQNSKANRKHTAIRWAEKFADFKALDKQRSTYLEGLIPRAIHDDGIIYTNYKEHNTVTARLSGSEPNLQNITRVKEGLPNIRSLFISGEGWSFIHADYSQAELRTIAALSGDDKLTQIYRKGLDLHSIAAERFYGVNFTKEQRSKAKNMNFGVAFRQSAETFQEKHDIPKDEAQAFIDWWWAEFKQVAKWEEEVERQVSFDGFVQSPFGHKRRFHLITRDNKNAVFREAINFFPQNIASQFTNFSMIELVGFGTIPPLTVHDSLTVRGKVKYVDGIAKKLKEVMTSAPKKSIGWDFPFEVDIQIGNDWGHLEDYDGSIDN